MEEVRAQFRALADDNEDCIEVHIRQEDGQEVFSEKWGSFASFQAMEKNPFDALDDMTLAHLSYRSGPGGSTALDLPTTHVHAAYSDSSQRYRTRAHALLLFLSRANTLHPHDGMHTRLGHTGYQRKGRQPVCGDAGPGRRREVEVAERDAEPT